MLGHVATEVSHSSPEPLKCLAFPAQGDVLATSPTGDRWVLPAQCPGCKTPSRSAIFLSASRRRGHFSSKMQPSRKGSAGSPAGPDLQMPGASLPAALLTPPCTPPGPRTPLVLAPHSPSARQHSQGLLPLCEDERTKWLSSPRRIPPGLGSKASHVPPAPDGARATGRPRERGGWFPHRLQVDNQRIMDSLICSPLTRCPSSTQLLIHTFTHSPLTPSDSHRHLPGPQFRPFHRPCLLLWLPQ